jgi:AraC-like DNA-binding protein
MRGAIPAYVHLPRAKDLIDRDYAQPLDVPALAREAHASTAHFSRSFKRTFGETPHQSLLRRRIERAEELLRNRARARAIVSGAAMRRRRRRSPGCFTLTHTRPVRSSSSREADERDQG